MPNCLRDARPAGRQSVPDVDVVNHSIGGRDKVRNLLGLVRREVEYLDPAAGNLDRVIVPVLVPV